MSVEIEAKLKVDSLEAVAEKLSELGAEFVEEQHQSDFYFDDAQRTMTACDKCLRIRKESAGDSVRQFLTFKGPRQKSELKKRQETNIEITDADSARKLLAALGYEHVLTVEKKRRLWHLGRCDVCLDELPGLGSFVEIEGAGESEIANIQKKLGLESLPHIPQSYASLLSAKLIEKNSES